VLEDTFAAGRPPLEDVGVDIVTNVEPYELMKLRLANGTHQALCYFGHLLGHRYVHEAINDLDIRALLLRYIDEEAVPTLQPIPESTREPTAVPSSNASATPRSRTRSPASVRTPRSASRSSSSPW